MSNGRATAKSTAGRKAGPGRKTGTDWERLRAMTDAEIRAGIESDPDASATDETFWQGARVVMPKPKETITIRLDADVLAWFRQQARGYQTRINAVLRSYMQAHQKEKR